MDKTFSITFVDTHHNRKVTYDNVTSISCGQSKIIIAGADIIDNEPSNYVIDVYHTEYDYFKVIKE